MCNLSSLKKSQTSLEAVLLSIPAGYECVDLSLYKVKDQDLQHVIGSFLWDVV